MERRRRFEGKEVGFVIDVQVRTITHISEEDNDTRRAEVAESFFYLISFWVLLDVCKPPD